MNIVKTVPTFGTYIFMTHTIVENFVNYQVINVNENGLTKKYTCF